MILIRLDILTWLVSVIFTVTRGHDVFLQHSKVEMTIPVTAESLQILKKNPLYKMKVKFMTTAVDPKNFSFYLEDNKNFFRLDEENGELWLDGRNLKKLKPQKIELILELLKNREIEAVQMLNINFVDQNLTTFCKKHICFWDHIEFRVVESFNNSVKYQQEIGDLSAKITRKLCAKYETQYNLLNASEFLKIENGKMIPKIPFNYEGMPGPHLSALMRCNLKSDKRKLIVEKVVNISIIDRNDNLIEIQKNHLFNNITRDDPYFVKDEMLDKQSFIIFTDKDTTTINDDVDFQLVDDDDNIFKHFCNKIESDHLKNSTITTFYCNLKFARNGYFARTPYCVVLQAKELMRSKVYLKNATICVNANLENLHNYDKLPKPMSLTRSSGKRAKFLVSPVTEMMETSGANIEYPKEVVLLTTAALYSRVAEPLKEADRQVKFKLHNNPLNAFDITRTGGIIYVLNPENLIHSMPASYHIEVDWSGGQSTEIKIKLKSGQEPICKNNMKSNENFCSFFYTKEDCENACGVGSPDLRCKWRQGPSHFSKNYTTCSPDLVTCPDQKCDALEKMAYKKKIFTCLQDCVVGDDVVNPGLPRKEGIGAHTGTHVCHCDTKGHCLCSRDNVTDFDFTTTSVSDTTAVVDSSGDTDMVSIEDISTIHGLHPEFVSEVPSSHHKVNQHSSEVRKSICGPGCIFLISVCPIFLIVITICLICMRRHYEKKLKKNMLFDEGVTYTTGINRNQDQDSTYDGNSGDQIDSKLGWDSKWEFDRSKLKLDVVLGEGEFGKVLKGYATDINGEKGVVTVAVKTLKTASSSAELLALLSECQLLQEVSHHNVIKMLGACTKGEPPLIIIEYCCFGSLRNYLRICRKVEESGAEYVNTVEKVTAKDILSFAWQICKGMAYLADMKLVHRDLAARNVLLAEGKICKISDFGLTRDVYEDDAYLKKSKDRVPVKWMAPESLSDHVYTSKTDVWSFGIVGWELITLGATPYPGIPPQNLYHLLKSGYRMECPENCSMEIYAILMSCWADDPNQRPSFKFLCEKFERLLGKSAKYLELDDSAVSNPVYLDNIDETKSCSISEKDSKWDDVFEEKHRIASLWTFPQFKCFDTLASGDTSKSDNPQALMKYDVPRKLIEMRYKNDLYALLPILRRNKITSINTSCLDLLSLQSDPRSFTTELGYDVPSLKRSRSYMEMNFTQGKNGEKRQLECISFDDNNEDTMSEKRKTINDNLNLNNLDKMTNKDIIAFKFSDHNDLNQHLTTAV